MRARTRRDAALLACVCRASAVAYRRSRWFNTVRVTSAGDVLEPAGTFDATVLPGEAVQDAVDRCPPGGSLLLSPGAHAGPLLIAADKVVHVFGRGRATLRTTTGEGATLVSLAHASTFDGLLLKRDVPGGKEKERFWSYCVFVHGGGLRLQNCAVTSKSLAAVGVDHGASPTIVDCRIHHCVGPGILFVGHGTRGTVLGCEIDHNLHAGVTVDGGADPLLALNYFHDGGTFDVLIIGHGTKGRLERNELRGSRDGGVIITEDAAPVLAFNALHCGGGAGVVSDSSFARLIGNFVWGNAGAGLSFRRDGAAPALCGNFIFDNFSARAHPSRRWQGEDRYPSALGPRAPPRAPPRSPRASGRSPRPSEGRDAPKGAWPGSGGCSCGCAGQRPLAPVKVHRAGGAPGCHSARVHP